MKYDEGYVAFIDILGFSNFVSKEENVEKVNDLFKFVHNFSDLFNDEEKLGVKVSFFSDSIVISAKLLDRLLAPILIAESFLIKNLHLLFRGGITYGKYYHHDGVTFGPAVVDAYKIEKSAYYSRIVFSDGIIDDEDVLEVFKDYDGKFCINPYGLLIHKNNAYGGDPDNKVRYPEGDPGENIYNIIDEEHHILRDTITTYMGTPYIEKYLWRIRPFNHTCEFIAKNPSSIEMFRDLKYNPTEDFSNSIRLLRLANMDFKG